MEAFLVSTVAVGLAEIGDKTQILSLLLAARFGRPVPIICGILVATLANHAAAGLLGALIGWRLHGTPMRWLLGLSFLGVAVWALFADAAPQREAERGRWNAFLSTLVAFFLAEMGDRTQIATIGLAARFAQFCPVVLGTTLGMMLANVPVVLIGRQAAYRLPLRAIRLAAAAAFAALGIATLSGLPG